MRTVPKSLAGRLNRVSQQVKLEASAEAPGVTLRAPTSDMGLAPFCKDTFEGKLRLQIWEKSVSGVDLVKSFIFSYC